MHTTVLLVSALGLSAGVLIGAAVAQPSPVAVVVPASVAVAGAVVLASAALPHVDLSPASLRAIGTIEGICICIVVPLAVGAMDVYSVVRHR